MYRCVRNYQNNDKEPSNNISLEAGEKVLVLELVSSDQQWARVQTIKQNTKFGVVPLSCLEEEGDVRFPVYVAKKVVCGPNKTEFAAMGDKVELLQVVSEYKWLMRHMVSRCMCQVDSQDFLAVTDDEIADRPVTEQDVNNQLTSRFVVNRNSMRVGSKGGKTPGSATGGSSMMARDETSPTSPRFRAGVRLDDDTSPTPARQHNNAKFADETSPVFSRSGTSPRLGVGDLDDDTSNDQKIVKKKSLRKRLSIRKERKTPSDKEERKKISEELDSTMTVLKASKNLRQKPEVRDLLTTIQRLRNDVNRGKDLAEAKAFLNKDNASGVENGVTSAVEKDRVNACDSAPIAAKLTVQAAESTPDCGRHLHGSAVRHSLSQPIDGDVLSRLSDGAGEVGNSSALTEDTSDTYTMVPDDPARTALHQAAGKEAGGQVNFKNQESGPSSYASIQGLPPPMPDGSLSPRLQASSPVRGHSLSSIEDEATGYIKFQTTLSGHPSTAHAAAARHALAQTSPPVSKSADSKYMYDVYSQPTKTSPRPKVVRPAIAPPAPPNCKPHTVARPTTAVRSGVDRTCSLPAVRASLGNRRSQSRDNSSKSSTSIRSRFSTSSIHSRPGLSRIASRIMGSQSPKEVAKRIVEDVRVRTGSSFDNSFVAAKTVLEHMKEYMPDKITEVEELEEALDQLQSNSRTDGSKDTHDGQRLDVIFAELTTMRNDGQQRNWTVHDDEDVITEYLEELLSILSEADQALCASKVAYDEYAILTTLTEYYQMETRVPIRLLLLKLFGGLCSLDISIPSVLLNTNLPLELARDIRANKDDFQKTLYSCLVGTMMFSSGEKPPVNYYETWNTDFMVFLLDLVENPMDEDEDERLVDCALGLVLGFNYHFLDIDVANNHVMRALQSMPTTRNFCEKVLLIINREEDPVSLTKPLVPDSVLKLLKDMFAERSTAGLFYTSDTHVLIGIVARQLNDLPEDSELRYHYLLLLEEMVQTTDYNSDLYGKGELATALVRIEEGEVVEARNRDTIARIRSLAPSLAAS